MNKNKIFTILILVFTITFSVSQYYTKTKLKVEKDIPIIRQYIFDLISLSRVDINNYSINTNFEDEYSNKNTNEIWKNSMTYNYIVKNKNTNYELRKSKKLLTYIENIVEEMHIKNIEFLKQNLIPIKNLDGANSNKELEKYITNTNKNKETLIKELSLLEDKIKKEINIYIKYLNIFIKNEKLSLEKELENFDEYFNTEYDEILNKQINVKINELLN